MFLPFLASVIAVFAVAFLLGSIPCGVIIGKAFYGVDPRSGGSGSIGATNSSRMMGLKGGIVVLILDMLKGAVAVLIARLVAHAWGYAPGALEFDLFVFGAAMFGIYGHCYSPWLGFKGGKGISTGFGVLVTADWKIGLGLVVVFLVFVLITRIISVGSIAADISVVVWTLIFHWGSIPAIIFAVLITAQVLYAHRANIGRLRRGEEPKFTGKKI